MHALDFFSGSQWPPFCEWRCKVRTRDCRPILNPSVWHVTEQDDQLDHVESKQSHGRIHNSDSCGRGAFPKTIKALKIDETLKTIKLLKTF